MNDLTNDAIWAAVRALKGSLGHRRRMLDHLHAGNTSAAMDQFFEYESATVNGAMHSAVMLDHCRARLNEAAALYRQGKHEQAADIFYDSLVGAMIVEKMEEME